jgi:RNA polymerase primary sigma factor
MHDYVLQLYLRDVSYAAPRAPTHDMPMADLGRFDESTRERLVLGNLQRVVRIAFDYEGLGLPLGDLINEGNIGLMRAAELFDPFRGVGFFCYAKGWIRMQMQRALCYQSRTVNLPADFRWRRNRVNGAEERLTAKLHREPNDNELAGASGIALPEVKRLRHAPAPSFVPLESPWPGGEADLTLAEVIADDSLPTPDSAAAQHSDREYIDGLLATLNPRERQVIRLRFGLEDGYEHTFEEVGQILGYVRQGIHRIETVALAKLRKHARFLRLGDLGQNPSLLNDGDEKAAAGSGIDTRQ